MRNQEKFVVNGESAIATPHSRILKTIQEFYSYFDSSFYLEANNALLNTFLENYLEHQQTFCPKHVQDTVFALTLQNKFLIELKEVLDELNNSKTE